MATRTFTQSRWRGEVSSIKQLATDLVDRIQKRTGQEPVVVATLQLARGDEDHYYGNAGLAAALAKLDSANLRNVEGLQVQVGRFRKDRESPEDSLAVTVTFSASTGMMATAPAVAVDVSGHDTEIVDGLRTRVAEAVRGHRPRVPAPPFAVTYYTAYFATFAYGFCLAVFGLLDWLPGGLGGSVLYLIFILLPSTALGYLIFWSAKHFIPPLEILARIVHLREGGEGLDFLGFHHRHVRMKAHHQRHIHFLARWPSSEAMGRARDRIREITDRKRLRLPVETIVQDLNRFLRGWADTSATDIPPITSTRSATTRFTDSRCLCPNATNARAATASWSSPLGRRTVWG